MITIDTGEYNMPEAILKKLWDMHVYMILSKNKLNKDLPKNNFDFLAKKAGYLQEEIPNNNEKTSNNIPKTRFKTPKTPRVSVWDLNFGYWNLFEI